MTKEAAINNFQKELLPLLKNLAANLEKAEGGYSGFRLYRPGKIGYYGTTLNSGFCRGNGTGAADFDTVVYYGHEPQLSFLIKD
ncbi:MAG: hypothetical protein KGJ06_03370, partial [Pseudomonadota bacterium]|nr:hypothetical protein [Pseudomonadota bacterium]